MSYEIVDFLQHYKMYFYSSIGKKMFFGVYNASFEYNKRFQLQFIDPRIFFFTFFLRKNIRTYKVRLRSDSACYRSNRFEIKSENLFKRRMNGYKSGLVVLRRFYSKYLLALLILKKRGRKVKLKLSLKKLNILFKKMKKFKEHISVIHTKTQKQINWSNRLKKREKYVHISRNKGTSYFSRNKGTSYFEKKKEYVSNYSKKKRFFDVSRARGSGFKKKIGNF